MVITGGVRTPFSADGGGGNGGSETSISGIAGDGAGVMVVI